MSSKVEQFLIESRRLHELLNNRSCPDDIDVQHQDLFWRRKSLLEATSKMLGTQGCDVHMHDSFIKGFSEKRTAGGWRSKFYSDAIAYGPDEEGNLTEKGYCRLSFQIDTKQPLRPMSGKEIYSLLIDEKAGKLGASFHQPGRNMGIVVIDYTSLTIDRGPVRSWEDLRQDRLASTPKVDATLEIIRNNEVEKIAAKWYTDGTILLLDSESWTSYSVWCGGKYAQEIPGVSQIFIDAGVGGARSEVGVQSDDHGPSYANVDPLKSWMRRQSIEAGKSRAALKPR